MSGILALLKIIDQFPRKILPHAEKTLLRNIAIFQGDNEYIWPNNQQLADRIGEDIDYAKQLLSRLKRKKLIKIEGRGKKRKIYFDEAAVLKLFRDRVSPKKQVCDRVSPNRDRVSRSYNIKDKEKTNKAKDKLGASPNFVNKKHPGLNQIMNDIPFKTRIKRIDVNEALLNHGIGYVQWLTKESLSKDDEDDNMVGYFNNGIKGYYRAYLDSEEYQVANTIAEAGFRSMNFE